MFYTYVNKMLLLALLLSGTFLTAHAQDNDGLFLTPTENAVAARSVDDEPTIIRRRAVNINLNVLPTGLTRSGTVISLNCFDDVKVDIVLEKLELRDEFSYTWTGYVLGEEGISSVTLVVNDGVIIGNIRSASLGYFQIRIASDGTIEVREIDESQYGVCGVDGSFNMPSLGEPTSTRSAKRRGDTYDVFDVMVVYTPDAKTDAGGTAAIEAIIELAVSEANEVFTNSLVTSQLRLVHMEEIAYTHSGSYSTDLDRLWRRVEDGGDTWINSVHTIRDTYGADMVSMFIEDPVEGGTAGIAAMMTDTSRFENPFVAFSVVDYDTAVGNYTFIHELGHNMGCAHAVGDGSTNPTEQGDGVFNYSHGWRFDSDQYRTVMAYQPGTRIPYFSNPDVDYPLDLVATGQTLGELDEASNAESINTAAPEIVSWRDAVQPLSVIPSSGFNPAGPEGGSFSPVSKTFTLTNTDGLASINWTATSSETWLTLSSSGGTLTSNPSSGESIDLVVSVNSGADSLLKGRHTATVTITDTTNTKETTRDVNLEVLYYGNTFDSNPGWTTGAGWDFGTPKGYDTTNGNPDPTSGYTGSFVYGVNLGVDGDPDNGGYSVNVSPASYLVTTAINLSNAENTQLTFARWLNHAGPFYDGTATVDVSSDNSNWTSLYALSNDFIEDSSWTTHTYDISSVADEESTVYIRWGYSSGLYVWTGWNIDDVQISGDPAGTTPTDLAEAWVDFAWGGTESGTDSEPFNTVDEAVTALKDDGTGVMKIKGDTADGDSAETPTITKGMTIQAINGTISIGSP